MVIGQGIPYAVNRRLKTLVEEKNVVTALLPILRIRTPEGQTFEIELDRDRVTIGRFAELNDIGLEPDPQQLVSRRAHCVLEREADVWWVYDNNSVNRTFIKRAQVIEVINERTPLRDGDAIRILGMLFEDNDPAYWELEFHDPLRTNRVIETPQTVFLEYDWVQARLFRIKGTHREEISNLRPQEHKLIRYIDQRNRANNNTPVMCTYQELIEAIWGDEPDHMNSEVNHLVYGLRQKIEFDPGEPQFLQSVPGLGYRLETRILR
jgi:hypothetical protein